MNGLLLMQNKMKVVVAYKERNGTSVLQVG
mgnify:CR=1 FL=1